MYYIYNILHSQCITLLNVLHFQCITFQLYDIQRLPFDPTLTDSSFLPGQESGLFELITYFIHISKVLLYDLHRI